MSSFCAHCGAPREEAADFCVMCGQRFSQEIAANQPVTRTVNLPLRWLIAATAVVTIGVGAWLFARGGLGSGPADVFKDFISAVDHKDVDRAMNLLSSGSRNPMVEGMLKMAISMGDGGMACRAGAKVASMETTVETIQDNKAHVELRVACTDGQTSMQKSDLVREQGSWKLVLNK